MVDDAFNDPRVLLEPAELGMFAQKLNVWAEAALSARERAFLEQMLADAADVATQDVSGYANLSSLDVDDVGGYAQVTATAGALTGAVIGYAQGLAEDAAGGAGGAFDPDFGTP